MNNSNLYDQLYDNLMRLLIDKKINLDGLENEISKLNTIFSNYYPEQQIDEEDLLRKIIFDYGIFEGSATVLKDNRDHEEWLANERASIEWNFWSRYKKYLETVEKYPPTVVSTIDEVTDDILKLLESPRRQGQWDRRGMVVGDVQSGKTSNYTGLISKAADAGYKIIIVLAGLNNDLRSQTQKRIDRGFIGRDTQKKESYDQTSSKIGVGLLPGFIEPPVIAVTSADSSGDYKKNVHNSVTITPGGDPIIAVVKKNVTPLRNLLNWFQGDNPSGVIANVPLLLIDDEADNASIDTKAIKRIGDSKPVNDDPEINPTAINGLIRQILNCFSQSAYVGYTATPFANIFIYPSNGDDSQEFGEDLYPRSFIVNLHAPSNYIGPEKVFGLYEDKTAGIEHVKPLPLIRVVDDYDAYFYEKHKKDLVVTGLPDSLYRAIYAFILSAAARDVRGQGKKHHSMLVHVTRFVAVQGQITELIKTKVKTIVAQLEMQTGPQYENLIKLLKSMWEEDFVPTTNTVMTALDDNSIRPISWDDIQPRLYPCASKIEVKAVNGKVADGGLNYDAYPEGCSVIAVGGDKLSRGLTLEGLSVSYYSRVSKMYDTLLQMGRWFGYRNGYADLIRLYTSKQLKEWYQDIAVANEELRRELDDMAEMNATPETYGLKVRTHPDGMMITAINKMRNSQSRKVTYAGRLIQITRYYKNDNCNRANIDFTDKWLRQFGAPQKIKSNNYIWEGVEPDDIIDFLNNIRIHPSCTDASPKIVSNYIRTQVEDNELINWTVALISTQTGAKIEVAEQKVGLTWRTDNQTLEGNGLKDEDTVYLIRNNLITESDQGIDLSKAELQRALEMTQDSWVPSKRSPVMPKDPSPKMIRACRKKTNALLMIYIFQSGNRDDNDPPIIYDENYLGYAISFPASDTAKSIEYKVDEVYLRNDINDE